MRIKELLAWAASVCLVGAGVFWYSSDPANAEAICVTLDQMKKITTEGGMSPVFHGSSENNVSYVVFGQPETGEWIALRVTEKPAAACIMTYGLGFAAAAPKEAVKK